MFRGFLNALGSKVFGQANVPQEETPPNTSNNATQETPTENSTKDQNVSGNDQDGGSRDSKNNSAVCDVKDGSASSPELSPLDSPADQPRKPECLAKEGGAGDCTSPRSSVGGSGRQDMSEWVNLEMPEGRSPRGKNLCDQSSTDPSKSGECPTNQSVIEESPTDPDKSGEYPTNQSVIEESSTDPDKSREYPTNQSVIEESPTDPDKSGEYPTNQSVSEESPTDPDKSGEYPTNQSVSEESPTDAAKSGECPTDQSVIEESPTDPDKSREYPTNQSVSEESPTDADKSRECPTDQSVSEESPTDPDKSREYPTNQSVSEESPTDAAKSGECPTDQSVIEESPTDPDKSREYPTNQSVSEESPTDADKSREYPTNQSVSEESPTDPAKSGECPTDQSVIEESPTDPDKSGEYPTNQSVSEESPTDPDKSGEYPTNQSVSEESPTDADKSREYPTNQSVIEESPTDPDKSGEYPTNQSVSEESPTDADKSREYPTNQSVSEESPTDPDKSGEYPTNQSVSEESPTDPDKSRECPTNQRVSEESPTDPDKSGEYPTNQSVSEESPTDPDKSRECPTNERVSEESSTDPDKSGEYPTNQSVSEESPTDPDKSRECPTDQSVIEESSTDPDKSTECPRDQSRSEESSTDPDKSKECPTNQSVSGESSTDPDKSRECPTSQSVSEESSTDPDKSKECPTNQRVSEESSTDPDKSRECPTNQSVIEESPTDPAKSGECPTNQSVSEESSTDPAKSGECPTNQSVSGESSTDPDKSRECPTNQTVHEESSTDPAKSSIDQTINLNEECLMNSCENLETKSENAQDSSIVGPTNEERKSSLNSDTNCLASEVKNNSLVEIQMPKTCTTDQTGPTTGDSAVGAEALPGRLEDSFCDQLVSSVLEEIITQMSDVAIQHPSPKDGQDKKMSQKDGKDKIMSQKDDKDKNMSQKDDQDKNMSQKDGKDKNTNQNADANKTDKAPEDVKASRSQDRKREEEEYRQEKPARWKKGPKNRGNKKRFGDHEGDEKTEGKEGKKKLEPINPKLEHEDFLKFTRMSTERDVLIRAKKLIYKLAYLKHVSQVELEAVLLDQYNIAVRRKVNGWIDDARYYAEIMVSRDWIDEYLLFPDQRENRLRQAKPKKSSSYKSRNARYAEYEEPFPRKTGGMCQDVRLLTNPNLTVIRVNMKSGGPAETVQDSSKGKSAMDSQEMKEEGKDVKTKSENESEKKGPGTGGLEGTDEGIVEVIGDDQKKNVEGNAVNIENQAENALASGRGLEDKHVEATEDDQKKGQEKAAKRMDGAEGDSQELEGTIERDLEATEEQTEHQAEAVEGVSREDLEGKDGNMGKMEEADQKLGTDGQVEMMKEGHFENTNEDCQKRNEEDISKDGMETRKDDEEINCSIEEPMDIAERNKTETVSRVSEIGKTVDKDVIKPVVELMKACQISREERRGVDVINDLDKNAANSVKQEDAAALFDNEKPSKQDFTASDDSFVDPAIVMIVKSSNSPEVVPCPVDNVSSFDPKNDVLYDLFAGVDEDPRNLIDTILHSESPTEPPISNDYTKCTPSVMMSEDDPSMVTDADNQLIDYLLTVTDEAKASTTFPDISCSIDDSSNSLAELEGLNDFLTDTVTRKICGIDNATDMDVAGIGEEGFGEEVVGLDLMKDENVMQLIEECRTRDLAECEACEGAGEAPAIEGATVEVGTKIESIDHFGDPEVSEMVYNLLRNLPISQSESEYNSLMVGDSTSDDQISAQCSLAHIQLAGDTSNCINMCEEQVHCGPSDSRMNEAQIEGELSETASTEVAEPCSLTKDMAEPYSLTKDKGKTYSPTKGMAEPCSLTKDEEEPYSPTKGTIEPYSPTKDKEEPYYPTKGTTEPYSPTKGTIEPYSPTKDMSELYSPVNGAVAAPCATESSSEPCSPSPYE